MRITMVQLKTQNSKKLLQYGKELLEFSALFSDDTIFEGSWAKRDAVQMSTRLETASNKCSGIMEDDLKGAADELADKLATENDALNCRFHFLDAARQKPNDCMLIPVQDPAKVCFFRQLVDQLSLRVFTSISCAGIQQCETKYAGSPRGRPQIPACR